MLKKILYTIGVFIIPLYAATGFYAVEPEETAVTYIFGKMIDKNVEAGIHWNLPYPLGRQTVKTTKANLILSVGETAPPLESFTFGARNLWMTGGASLVEIQIDIQYTITQLDLYETSHDRPEVFLDFLAQKMLTRSLIEQSVDDILTTGRQLLGSRIQLAMQTELDNANIGIQVQDVIVKSLSPPNNDGVADAFQLVQNANSDRYRRLEQAETHDEIWNASQRELLRTGQMHNYMRMLWGKKILEWSPDPETAAERMIYINDKWALDGRDPNSYTGIFWVLGRHDNAWGPERPIFGKVRYRSSESAMRKLKLKNYINYINLVSYHIITELST